VVEIVPMRPAHLDEVVAIEERVSGIPWSRRLFEEELAVRGTRRYLVALEKGVVVGYLGMMFVADEAHITVVGVDPAQWGRGIATRLLLAALEDAHRAGARDCTLEVRLGNDRAKRLYQRFGFAPVALRRDYYHDNHEDALVMWLYDLDDEVELTRRDRIRASLEQEHDRP
jgi:ribosomal-protein-alanine N-acetyltransferase